jgi:hypothetical protein
MTSVAVRSPLPMMRSPGVSRPQSASRPRKQGTKKEMLSTRYGRARHTMDSIAKEMYNTNAFRTLEGSEELGIMLRRVSSGLVQPVENLYFIHIVLAGVSGNHQLSQLFVRPSPETIDNVYIKHIFVVDANGTPVVGGTFKPPTLPIIQSVKYLSWDKLAKVLGTFPILTKLLVIDTSAVNPWAVVAVFVKQLYKHMLIPPVFWKFALTSAMPVVIFGRDPLTWNGRVMHTILLNSDIFTPGHQLQSNEECLTLFAVPGKSCLVQNISEQEKTNLSMAFELFLITMGVTSKKEIAEGRTILTWPNREENLYFPPIPCTSGVVTDQLLISLAAPLLVWYNSVHLQNHQTVTPSTANVLIEMDIPVSVDVDKAVRITKLLSTWCILSKAGYQLPLVYLKLWGMILYKAFATGLVCNVQAVEQHNQALHLVALGLRWSSLDNMFVLKATEGKEDMYTHPIPPAYGRSDTSTSIISPSVHIDLPRVSRWKKMKTKTECLLCGICKSVNRCLS